MHSSVVEHFFVIFRAALFGTCVVQLCGWWLRVRWFLCVLLHIHFACWDSGDSIPVQRCARSEAPQRCRCNEAQALNQQRVTSVGLGTHRFRFGLGSIRRRGHGFVCFRRWVVALVWLLVCFFDRLGVCWFVCACVSSLVIPSAFVTFVVVRADPLRG